MFRYGIACATVLALSFAAGRLEAQTGGAIQAPDGTVTFDEKGYPTFSGGSEVFAHYFNQSSEGSTGIPFVDNMVSKVRLDSVELFKDYPETERLAEVPGIQALQEQSDRGGLAASFSDMVLEELALMQQHCIKGGAPDPEASIIGKYGFLLMHTNSIRGNATISLYSAKTLICSNDEESLEIPLNRRWVITVLDGLEQGNIDKVIVKPNGNEVEMRYMYFAKGKQIRLQAYYSNLTLKAPYYEPGIKLISAFDAFGNRDPRNAYYDPKNASCLDILFRDPPPADAILFSVPTGNMLFCASGCVPGDVSATK